MLPSALHLLEGTFVCFVTIRHDLVQMLVLCLDDLVSGFSTERELTWSAQLFTCHCLHGPSPFLGIDRQCGTSQRVRDDQACAMRTRLPEGSRNAQSRAPQGWDVGSWSTSAPEARTFSKVASRSAVRKIAACSEPCVTSARRASPSACERPPCGWDRTMSTSCPGAPTVTQRNPSEATSLRTSRPSASR